MRKTSFIQKNKNENIMKTKMTKCQLACVTAQLVYLKKKEAQKESETERGREVREGRRMRDKVILTASLF